MTTRKLLLPILCLTALIAGTGPADDVGVAAKARPTLVSFVVTPAPLEANITNAVSLKITFRDREGDLRGGKLTLTVQNSDGTATDVSVPLNKKTYRKKTGMATLPVNLDIGPAGTATLTAKLTDKAGNVSRAKKLSIDVLEGDDGGGGGGGGGGDMLPPFGVDPGNRAQNFTLRDHTGAEVSLHDYTGSIILLDFSAEWCPNCQNQASDAEQFYQVYKNRGVVFLTVMFESANGSAATAQTAQRWRNRYGLTFPVLADDNEKTYNLYRKNTLYQPLNLVIDRSLVIRYKKFGYFEDELHQMVEDLVNEP